MDIFSFQFLAALIAAAFMTVGLFRWFPQHTSQRCRRDSCEADSGTKRCREEAEADLLASRNEFIATLSHEMRTSLNIVQGCKEVLTACAFNEVEREHFVALDLAAQSMELLLDNIYGYSTITSSPFALSPVPFTVRVRAGAIGAQLNKELRESNTRVRFIVEDPVPDRIFADAVQISRVWRNLVHATKALIPLSPAISVEIGAEYGNKDFIILRTKIDCSSAQLSRTDLKEVAEILENNPDSSTDSMENLLEWQVQLIYAAGVARALGGAIEVEVRDNGEFSLRFDAKCKRADLAPFQEFAKVEVADLPEDSWHNSTWLVGTHILIVEDEGVNRKLATKLFERWGASVESVATGKEALARHLNSRYDMILLDLELPDLSGLQVAKLIRGYERSRDFKTPIVCCSAHVREEIQEQCLTAGMNDFITKPIDQRKLHAVVQNLLFRADLRNQSFDVGCELSN